MDQNHFKNNYEIKKKRRKFLFICFLLRNVWINQKDNQKS